ncbi:hypothetical protein TVNIR_3651 [Thioalkalivibrio nitratireducens DSM 14787]|uniref:Uncharacterized protein n=1 Tax=Thioalkalivibrio nitratireducens (strain DSM 14787 / UNIQEM 213 / ALEN2) TaxID=1255043 RepID=L0E3N4_THIND|nr:hypothetical protein [Thioalkalivibrio nitratireducens]AGA35281.1 hypothetical protein TVNIR_3651 [Thioalkalivibrio nitratireducens DSM 14787]
MFGLLHDWPARQLEWVRARFAGHTLIVHRGFPRGWLKEQLRQPGGGGHLRLGSRRLPALRPTPIEWLAQGQVLPLGLPLLLRIRERDARVRHLHRRVGPVHPSEIAWFLDELEERHHAWLRFLRGPGRIETLAGIAMDDNEVPTMLEHPTG